MSVRGAIQGCSLPDAEEKGKRERCASIGYGCALRTAPTSNGYILSMNLTKSYILSSLSNCKISPTPIRTANVSPRASIRCTLGPSNTRRQSYKHALNSSLRPCTQLYLLIISLLLVPEREMLPRCNYVIRTMLQPPENIANSMLYMHAHIYINS